jgi:hypothetical protein
MIVNENEPNGIWRNIHQRVQQQHEVNNQLRT